MKSIHFFLTLLAVVGFARGMDRDFSSGDRGDDTKKFVASLRYLLDRIEPREDREEVEENFVTEYTNSIDTLFEMVEYADNKRGMAIRRCRTDFHPVFFKPIKKWVLRTLGFAEDMSDLMDDFGALAVERAARSSDSDDKSDDRSDDSGDDDRLASVAAARDTAWSDG